MLVFTSRRFPIRWVRRASALLVMLGALSVIVACHSDTAKVRKGSSAATATKDVATPGSQDAFPDGLHNVRYCEVLLVTKQNETYVAEVWNTMGYSTCPQSEWSALNSEEIRASTGALVVVLNGPRYWVLDEIDSEIRRTAATRTFGAIKMFRAARVNLGTQLPNQDPYVERPVARETVFSFHAGSEVYMLTDPNGHEYVMQSYSQIKDPTMSIERLRELGGDLERPESWTYSVFALTGDLNLTSTDESATMNKDKLQTTYQMYHPG